MLAQLIAPLSLIFATQGELDPYRDAMARAATLERKQRFVEAASALEAIAGGFPQDYALHLRLAWLHFRIGQYPNAVDQYRRSLSLAPDSTDARNGLAWSLLRLGRYAEAKAEFQTSLDRSIADETAQKGLAETYLLLAWQHFSTGHFPEALASYQRSLTLSGSADARNGVGWSLFNQGMINEARSEWRTVLEAAPENLIARKGLDLSETFAVYLVAPTLSSSTQFYQDHPVKEWATGLSFTLPIYFRVPFFERGTISMTYRYSHFEVSEWPASLPNETVRDENGFDQNEIYLSAGVGSRALSIRAHFATLEDGSLYLRYSRVVGLSLRYSPWGDIMLESSAGFYSDMNVYRASPAWRLPILDWLDVTPALALQIADARAESHLQLDQKTELLTTLMLTVTAASSFGRVAVGAKYGDEVRPAYLDVPLVYNHQDRNAMGIWVAGQIQLGRGWSLHCAYELEQLSIPFLQTERRKGTLHIATLGATWSSLH